MYSISIINDFLANSGYFVRVAALESVSTIRSQKWSEQDIHVHQAFIDLVKHEFGKKLDYFVISKAEIAYNIERLSELNGLQLMIEQYQKQLDELNGLEQSFSRIVDIIIISKNVLERQ